MTKLKRYLRNSAKAGLLLNTLLIFSLILGCSSSTKPTFTQEDIPDAIRDICKKEFNIDLTTKLVGKTLWVYMPVTGMFQPSEKPEKSYDRYQIKSNDSAFEDGSLKVQYEIDPIPETEVIQEVNLAKSISEKTNQAWSVIRRVLFSMDRAKSGEPDFICFVLTDIDKGYEIKQTSYYLDLKKISYNYISTEEYQHRAIQEVEILPPELIIDREGSYIKYTDFTLPEFVAKQIQYRIRIKFQKPEIEKNADIDKEVEKVVAAVIKIYGLKDFDGAQLYNLVNNNKLFLSTGAIWERATK
ncbi:MAG: hypothetical protein PHJ00_02135 [Candidatus Omnitrophica bacterium]|nr:hypothetical protein [Candidatus Omnitrophota bacterium]MDD5654159.1 hypothetical protein [Candidatus Omnitrophota bacterium]